MPFPPNNAGFNIHFMIKEWRLKKNVPDGKQTPTFRFHRCINKHDKFRMNHAPAHIRTWLQLTYKVAPGNSIVFFIFWQAITIRLNFLHAPSGRKENRRIITSPIISSFKTQNGPTWDYFSDAAFASQTQAPVPSSYWSFILDLPQGDYFVFHNINCL